MKDEITTIISDEDLQDLDQLHTLARYFCEMTSGGSNTQQWKEDNQSVKDGFKVLERLWKEWGKQ